MKIVIPSHKRSTSIGSKTLKVLKTNAMDKHLIYIFVANKEEYNDYLANVDSELYGHLIIGELGLKNQRNFITNYFEEGEQIVSFDDDVEKIEYLANDKLVEMDYLDFFIKKAFDKCKQENCGLWGVYPVHNAYFMREKQTLIYVL